MSKRDDKEKLRMVGREHEIWKVVRTILQIILMGAVVFLIVQNFVLHPSALVTAIKNAGNPAVESTDKPDAEAEKADAPQTEETPEVFQLVSSADVVSCEPSENAARTDGSSFIAVSYNGLTTSSKLESRVVNNKMYEEQIAALHASGYVTITQNDIIDYYLYGKQLPEKAMLLIFEDGIYQTIELAQPSLMRYNYIGTACTYANNLTNDDGRYITTQNLHELLRNSYWEMGSNGYRLSYINVFDRYHNYFGHMLLEEFRDVSSYLRRDYNHYLMDFLRDERRLRQETVAEMRARIDYDYEQMREIYEAEIGYVPSLYILMHSNTRAFGNDPLVSDENKVMIQQTFDMNFNRQGSASNTRESSIYDLSRIQSRHYFHTNHLMMRIWDDTGDDVVFLVGDGNEAKRWSIEKGVAQFEQDRVILTSEPRTTGSMTLLEKQPKDIEMTVTLQGNKVGIQRIDLLSDTARSKGVEVALEFGELVIRDLSDSGENAPGSDRSAPQSVNEGRDMIQDGKELVRQNLFEFDGGPYVSEEEDEYNGLVALQETIIKWEEPGTERVLEAQAKLEELLNMAPTTLAEGGKPFYPELDISDRDERRIRIVLKGNLLSVWMDDRPICESIEVKETGSGSVVLRAGVWKSDDNRYSQTNLADDVYDAVFIDPLITNADDANQIYYTYRQLHHPVIEETTEEEPDEKKLPPVLQFFVDNF